MSNGNFILFVEDIHPENVYKIVTEKLKDVNGLWVAVLDLCEMYGHIRYDIFDNIDDIDDIGYAFASIEYKQYENLPVFISEDEYLIIPNSMADIFKSPQITLA